MAAELKVKEIRSGRLGMLSKFGYYVQATVTGQGPVENWASHIADPFAVNRLSLEIATQYTPSVAMFAAAGKYTAVAPRWICPASMALTARSGWALTLQAAASKTT